MRPLAVLVACLLSGCAASTLSPSPPSEAAPALACAAPCGVIAADGSVHEPWIAIDPKDPQHVVAGGFGFSGSAQGLVVAVTRDAGATWSLATVGPIEGPSGAFYSTGGDIMLAFANDGTVLMSALMRRGGGVENVGGNDIDLAVWRSTDGGTSFPSGRIVADAVGLTAYLPATPGGTTAGEWFDKEHLVVDPATGEAHLFFNAVGPYVGVAGSCSLAPCVELRVIHSKDAGATWSPPAVVAPGKYGASAAAYDGTVLVTFRNPGYFLVRSADAGRTWSAPVPLGDRPGPDGTWQAAPVALWPANGTIHAALALAAGKEGETVVVQRSEDGGATWSANATAFPEVASKKRNPAMAVDPATGRGVLAAYQGADAMEVWAAPLVDGVPQAAFAASNLTAASYLYEYFGAAAAGDSAYLAWGDSGQDASPLMVARLRWGSP